MVLLAATPLQVGARWALHVGQQRVRRWAHSVEHKADRQHLERRLEWHAEKNFLEVVLDSEEVEMPLFGSKL
jgi:hypothetical protein